jgi:hypothetical protein
MKLEQIEAVIDLSSLSKVELYDLLGRAEQLHRKLAAERKRRQTESTSSTRDTMDHSAIGVEVHRYCDLDTVFGDGYHA